MVSLPWQFGQRSMSMLNTRLSSRAQEIDCFRVLGIGASPSLSGSDYQTIARTLHCHQAIASNSCFALGMLAEFDELVRGEPWRYRQLHWEASLLGQVLYLESEAAGLRGTGIGCFFDEAFHELLGLRDRTFQSLYHFTVGRPLVDERIITLPPYSHRVAPTFGS